MTESFDADKEILKHIQEKKLRNYEPIQYQSKSFNEYSSQQQGIQLQQNENQNHIFHRQQTQFETSREKDNFSNSSNNVEQQQLNDSDDIFSPPKIGIGHIQQDNMKSLKSQVASLNKKLEKSEKNKDKILEEYGKLKKENQQLINENLKLQQLISQLKDMIRNQSDKGLNINQSIRGSTQNFFQSKLTKPTLRKTLTPSYSALYLLNQNNQKKNTQSNEHKVIQEKPFDIKKLKQLIIHKLNLNQYTPKVAKPQTTRQKQKQKLF